MMLFMITLDCRLPAMVEVPSQACPVEIESPNLAAAGISESTYGLDDQQAIVQFADLKTVLRSFYPDRLERP